MNQIFQFPKTLKTAIIAIAAFSILLVAVSFLLQAHTAKEFWANLLLNGYLYLSIAGSATLFLAIHTISKSGWHVVIQRITESIGCYLPIAGLILLLVLPGMTSIYEWTHPTTDKLILAKQPFLNIPFWLVRTFGFIILWSILTHLIRKQSLLSDTTESLEPYKKMKHLSTIFIPLFVFTFFFSSWDWIMSLEPHWFSTMFGFYMVCGALASGVAAIIILVSIIKHFNGLQSVNNEHLHDLGKYLFAISIFWGYLWGSQYLLIWFANIPEETVYYIKRWNEYPVLMNVSVALNFFVPFLLLITRASKRNLAWLTSVALLVLIGHWVDLYINIMPGATLAAPSISLLAIGMGLLFFAIFLFVVIRKYTQAAEIPQNHPHLEESFNYENSY